MKLGHRSYFLGTDQGGNTEIGRFSSVAGGTYIHGNDNHACVMNPKLVSCFDFGDYGADFTRSGQSQRDHVIIGNDVWIGEHVQILSGVKIHDGAIVGAHSVVSKDIPPYAIAVGNPIEFRKFRFNHDIIEELLKIKWWNWDDTLIKNRISEFRDIDSFVEKYKV